MTTSNIKAIIQWDIHKVWETVLAVERYHTWRSDVSKTEWIDETQFIEYSPNGYPTTYTVTAAEPHKRCYWSIPFFYRGYRAAYSCNISTNSLQVRHGRRSQP